MNEARIELLFYYAYTEVRLGRPEQALLYLKAAKILGSADPYIHKLLCYIYCSLAKYTEARVELELYEQETGQPIEPHSPLNLMRAVVEYRLDDSDHSLSTMSRFVDQLRVESADES